MCGSQWTSEKHWADLAATGGKGSNGESGTAIHAAILFLLLLQLTHYHCAWSPHRFPDHTEAGGHHRTTGWRRGGRKRKAQKAAWLKGKGSGEQLQQPPQEKGGWKENSTGQTQVLLRSTAAVHPVGGIRAGPAEGIGEVLATSVSASLSPGRIDLQKPATCKYKKHL